MSVLLGVVGTLLLISWASARVRGVPWMSWGTPTKMRTDQRRAQYNRLRTGSIKPRSAWTQTPEVPTQKARSSGLRTRSIKPLSPWMGRQIKQPTTEAFLRLTELTHSEQVSDRLICDNLKRNPDRDELWAAEKAIYDIERDRMAR